MDEVKPPVTATNPSAEVGGGKVYRLVIKKKREARPDETIQPGPYRITITGQNELGENIRYLTPYTIDVDLQMAP